ncbi:MAG: type II toxin-antitoxin system prevent-host-death family antitoxin [Candidatus Omnitrophota bacterium]
MGTIFDRKQIVSRTELVRAFKKYEDAVSSHDIFIFKHNAPEAVLMDYKRYEQMKEQLEELTELLEHLHLYELIEQRKTGSEKKVSIEKLRDKYGL